MKETYIDSNGVLRTNHYGDDGWVRTKATQDVEPLTKRNNEARRDESVNAKKGDIYHYASIPMVIAEEMMKKGINIFNPDDVEAVKKEVDLHYPHLKTTNLRGW